MGSSKAGETGGDEEESPGDTRGSGRVVGGGSSGLRHVRVKLTPSRVETLLSSQVSMYAEGCRKALQPDGKIGVFNLHRYVGIDVCQILFRCTITSHFRVIIHPSLGLSYTPL